MSIAVHVFLTNSLLPSVKEWNAAIKAEGFDLALDAFDLRTDSGYRPATLKGEELGFEWSLSSNTYFNENPESPERAQVSACDLNASFWFGSRGDEHVAACIAGAVLAKMTDGFLMDVEGGGKLLRGEEALSAARLVLAEWLKLSQSPAKFITSATTSIFAPVMRTLGFVRVKPREFARMEQGIVQTFWIDKRDAEFRGGGSAEPLYPIQEFFSLKFQPFSVRLDDWHEADSKAHTDIAMKKVVDALLEHIYPWFEETKSDSDFLDYLLEFHNTSHHDIFDIGCLLAKLGRKEEAIEKLDMAVFEYEDDGRDWCPPKVVQCRELLAVISAGTADALLAKWKIQSLQNLGLKKLLQPPHVAKNKTPTLPTEASQNVPPVIPTDRVRTAALFSRQLVRPSIFEMIKRVLPGFRLIEQRGRECRFIRAGTGSLFDYVIFSRDWSGAIRVELAASYDSTWKRGLIGQLGCSNGLANLRLGLNRIQLSYRNVYNKNYYIYGRSIEEFQKQIHELESHLATYAPPFFLAARQIMQSRKLVQFGIKQVIENPLTEGEKAELKKEQTAYTGKPVANSLFVDLNSALKQFADAHPDIPKEERDSLRSLATELLFANLAPSAVLPQKKGEQNRIWKWFRGR